MAGVAKRLAKPKRGRPEHKPNAALRRKVQIFSGLGMDGDDIARSIKITKPTLHKHYQTELDNGHAFVKATVMASMFNIATGADGVAFKAQQYILNSRYGWSQFAPEHPKPTQKEEALGKKAQAEITAQTAHEDTEWGNLLQ